MLRLGTGNGPDERLETPAESLDLGA